MPQNQKLSSEEKLNLVQRCINGEISIKEAARIANVSSASIRRWIARYQMEGEETFIPTRRNRVYGPEQKLNAVHSYLSGEGSTLDISRKFKIRNPRSLEYWIEIYNNQGSLNSVKFSGGGSYISKGRKTTKEERVQIVNECIALDKNYGLIAIKYNISYQQARSWTLRFEKYGEAGLEDRRGWHKKVQSPCIEMENIK